MSIETGIDLLSRREDAIYAGRVSKRLPPLVTPYHASDLERMAYLLTPLAEQLLRNIQNHPLGEVLQASLKGRRDHAFRGLILPADPDTESLLKPYQNIRGLLRNLDQYGVDLPPGKRISMSLDDPKRAIAYSYPYREDHLGLVLVYNRNGLDAPYDPECDFQRNDVYPIPPYTFQELYLGMFYYSVE